jgi:hypothetical protein
MLQVLIPMNDNASYSQGGSTREGIGSRFTERAVDGRFRYPTAVQGE